MYWPCLSAGQDGVQAREALDKFEDNPSSFICPGLRIKNIYQQALNCIEVLPGEELEYVSLNRFQELLKNSLTNQTLFADIHFPCCTCWYTLFVLEVKSFSGSMIIALNNYLNGITSKYSGTPL